MNKLLFLVAFIPSIALAAPSGLFMVAQPFGSTLTSSTPGDPGAAAVDPDGTVHVRQVAGAGWGNLPGGSISTAGTNTTLLKNTAATVYNITLCNTSAITSKYVKFYDKATTPTCGTDVPKLRYIIPPGVGCIPVLQSSMGTGFVNGLGYCITGGLLDTDTTNVSLGDAFVDVSYQ